MKENARPLCRVVRATRPRWLKLREAREDPARLVFEVPEMRTVQSLKDELDKFPPDALCYAYDGEIRGVVVVTAAGNAELGWVHCGEGDKVEEATEVK